MVHINPHSIPKLSCRTFTTGARQLVVQEALDKVFSLPVRTLSLTPITIVASSSPFAGADRITFLAPEVSRCFSSASLLVKIPVDSRTMSTFFQGIFSMMGSA